jgi:hypothetical protein
VNNVVVPKKGDWILCKGSDVPGKVRVVSEREQSFQADFLPGAAGLGGASLAGEEAIPLSQIDRIITDAGAIRQFEKELKGEINWPGR